MLWLRFDWARMGRFIQRLYSTALLAMWALTFVSATIVLSVWETPRGWLLSIQWGGQVLKTCYAGTVTQPSRCCLPPGVIKVVNAPPSQNDYKGF